MKTQHKNNIDLTKILNKINNTKVEVGYHESAVYENGTPVAVVAAQNEFGNAGKNIPPRPFMRPAVTENKSKWKSVTKQNSKALVNGTMQVTQAFEKFGSVVAADIKNSIKAVTQPPLKESTIRARLAGKKQGKSVSLTVAKPLVDTGIMLNTVTSVVTSS